MEEIEEPITVTLRNGELKTFYKYNEEIFINENTMNNYIIKNFSGHVKVGGEIKEDNEYSIYYICKDENSEPVHTVILVL